MFGSPDPAPPRPRLIRFVNPGLGSASKSRFRVLKMQNLGFGFFLHGLI